MVHRPGLRPLERTIEPLLPRRRQFMARFNELTAAA